MTIFFGTNRTLVDGKFDSNRTDVVSYGAAEIDDKGNVTTKRVSSTSWSDDDVDTIVRSTLPILYFQHGFNYDFGDTIKEAERISYLLEQHGTPAIVVCFSWPSQNKLVSFPILQNAYLDDQKIAGASGKAIASFIDTLYLVRINIENSRVPHMVLLAHSMGNYALASALEHTYKGHVFNHAILAAADEQYDSFQISDRLGNLDTVAETVTVFKSRHDEALILSQSAIVNDIQRLGYDGPKMSPPGISVIDFTERDPLSTNADGTHQYFLNDEGSVAYIAGVVGDLDLKTVVDKYKLALTVKV